MRDVSSFQVFKDFRCAAGLTGGILSGCDDTSDLLPTSPHEADVPDVHSELTSAASAGGEAVEPTVGTSAAPLRLEHQASSLDAIS